MGEGEHTVLIETTGNESSYVAFDYAIYTSVVSVNLISTLLLTLSLDSTTVLIRRRYPVVQWQAL